MSVDNFVVSREEGRTGELYTQKHLNELITLTASSITDKSAEKIEGKDFTASIAGKELAVEVKTIRGFLFRTNDNEEETGTIGFELWKSKKRKTLGWLPQMLNPDGKKSVQPDILIFLLVAYDRPFASIVFENVPELFKRLKELSSKMEFNLDSIPVGDKAIAFAIPSGLLIKNMWLVPLAELEDLAHVVMIGEQPRFRPTIKAPGRLCKDVTQRDRYDHLCLLSKGHIPYDDQFEFKGNKAAQTITIAAHNLDVLEAINLDWYGSLKYMNRTGTFLRLWQGLYSFMLSIEFPAREYKGDRYFPIAYGEVSRWGYKNDIRSQPDTWFSVIKHLLEFGLLMHFRPHPNSTNPVDIAVNKNNPYLKSVEYYTPVALTNDELLNADCEAQDYMHLKRRTSTTSRAAMEFQSGPEVPKRAYQDDRKLTKQDNFVRNLAEQMLIKEVDNHNYIIVDHFFGKLWREIARSQKLKKIETIQSREDEKEQERYKKYLDALNLLRKEKKDFIDELRIYRIGPVRKMDIRWLGEIPYGTQIITYKEVPDVYYKQYYKARQEEKRKENAKRREKRRAKKEKQRD